MSVQQGLTIKADMHPMSAKFMVGDKELMVMSCDIRMRPDEVITATLEVPVEHIDMELAQSGVTIAPLDKQDNQKAAYVMVADDATPNIIEKAIKLRVRELEQKFPYDRFEIRVVRQSDIVKL